MAFSMDLGGLRSPSSPADVQIFTSDGSRIAAHSAVLAAASPVLERMIDRAGHGWDAECTVRILGVASGAVAAFLRFLYSACRGAMEGWEEEAMEAHGVALMALAHAYRVGWLKRHAEEAVAARLTAERAVDMMKMARLCDAPRLYLQCARLAGKDLAAVERSEAWRFASRHDPAVQVQLLQLLADADQRKKRWKSERASQEVYQQLSEAMISLKHIFTEGCMEASCDKVGMCHGLQQLMRHFTTCGKKLTIGGGCPHCKRIFQLLRLHSSICDRSDESCKVPLCNNFNINMQTEKMDKTWKLLVKKVMRARVISTLANRKVPEIVAKSWAKHSSRGAKLR